MHPIDKRYSITKEFCGKPTAQYVVRFLGAWAGSAPTKREALALAGQHNAKRVGVR